MKYVIVISNDDAGKNISKFLNNLPKNVILFFSEKECIHMENVEEKISGDYFIFPTTHKSESGTKSLTVHNIGNFNKAEYGGREKLLVPAYANLTKTLFEKLNEHGSHLNYEITLEVTHHGPFSKKPITFIEIGSSKEEWNDPKAGEAIAKAIKETLSGEIIKNRVGIGIGGPHYAPNFNKLLKTNMAVAHICPTYHLKNLNQEMLKQMIEKTT